MASDTYISEAAAMRVLMRDGDFCASQARIVLTHSRKQSFDGTDYYPMGYIYKRAKDNAARPD
jgi:hypothetical protein